MPYIKKEYRAELDIEIKALADKIKKISAKEGYEAAFVGFLDYCCVKLGVELMPARRYWAMCLVVGAFRNAADEFLRRVVGPYEDEKRAESGEVFDESILPKKRKYGSVV